MFYKKGEIRPYLLNNVVHFEKILKINKKEKTYTIEDIFTKEINIIGENDIFLGDDYRTINIIRIHFQILIIK